MEIGFIGIGLMGFPMSQRLLAAGHSLSVWNRSTDKALPLLSSGAKLAESLQALASHCEIIFLCLTDSRAVQDVWTQIQDSVASGSVIIDCSSIDPLITQELSRSAGSRGCFWIDCPVSGGVPGAKAGTLAMMAGGDVSVLDRLRPLLTCLSSKVTYMGPSGSGQYAKICNQMIVSCNALVIAEVVAFAEKSGVDSFRLAEAFSGGFADSKPLQILAPEMAARQFTPPKWHVDTLLKDLTMAVKHLERSDAQGPMTNLAKTLMQAHSAEGFGHQDPSTLIQRYVD